MKKFGVLLVSLFATVCLVAQPQNNVRGARSDAGRTTEKTMVSKVFNGERAYSIYLPQSYDSNPTKKYPVLYLLHGAGDDNKCYENKAGLASIANQLVNAGEASEMIIVTPNAGGELYQGYYNMENYPYETFFFDEFIPYIENTYRIIGDKNHRAIAGLSMGGGGSVSYGMFHPEMFTMVFGMSASLEPPLNGRPNGEAQTDREKASALVYNTRLANSCIKYFENATDTKIESLKAISWFFDCGDDDMNYLLNTTFFQKLKDKGIPAQIRVRDGGHNWVYWRESLYIALPVISMRFSK